MRASLDSLREADCSLRSGGASVFSYCSQCIADGRRADAASSSKINAAAGRVAFNL
ncbi:hypothetical protein BAUCODRAFT_33833 [Baudoinia panamericana UAMH 10762]|uniref:Uncharacterized protein n=1 Tax=Baudoinia panamericana (strain UAMH 10762) TaxID=717646 RepID=M2NC68_BAUPA|nr:uncharacterized protein BAUCODRAFT_33833 [Baudoinia panamericana UAMH 10762]EMC96475.1 hypothetical protein BAUCODRAFT_33833 [Baudoinia panamericana UAMH 10762]